MKSSFAMRLLATVFCVTGSAFAVDHNEAVNGDLSDDRFNPSNFVLSAGDNTFTVTHQGSPYDLDYMTITVPNGFVLSSLILEDFIAEPNNLAFFGVQEGATFTVDAGSATAADLLGGLVYGAPQIGQDVLPETGSLGGSMGFTPPLPAGTYTLWLQQTGPQSTAVLNFQLTFDGESVPTVSTWGLVVLALSLLVVAKVSRRKAVA